MVGRGRPRSRARHRRGAGPRPVLPVVADRLPLLPGPLARLPGAADAAAPHRRAWGIVIRRLFEAGTPHAAVHGAAVPADRVRHATALSVGARRKRARRPDHAAKAAYLNLPFFMARAAFYFAVLDRRRATAERVVGGAGRPATPASTEQADRCAARRPAACWSYILTVTFAVGRLADVARTRTGSRRSAGIALHRSGRRWRALAFAITVLVLPGATRADEPRAERRSHFHDLGKLLLAFVMLWAYLSLLAVPDHLARQPAGRESALPGAHRRAADKYLTIVLIAPATSCAAAPGLLLSRATSSATRAGSACVAWPG